MKKRLFFILTCIMLVLLPIQAQQARKVTGKVTDFKTDEELIGVTVKVKGASKSTVTDITGNYSIEVPDSVGTTLVFSYIGYDVTEEKVLKNKVINVKLSNVSSDLNEVVVVGYGSQKKESVIGSISSINNKSLVSVPVSNISQALAGKLSGIQVVQSSGEVGNDVADVFVRGMSTWNDATPLYVVDGIVRMEFAKIDPNEIETINVLKDASATAVFGVKGANGVIIITTKRGTIGKPKVSFTVQNAITEPIRIPQPLGAYDATSLYYLQDWGQFRSNTPISQQGLAYDLMMYRTGASPWTHPDVNWVNEVMKKTSAQQQYNVNISGGTKTVKYFVSGGLVSQDGFYKNDDLTKYARFNFRSNLDVEVSKELTASLNIGARVEDLDSPTSTIWSSWEIYRGAFSNTGRKYPVYNPDGSYAGNGSNLVKNLKEGSLYRNIKSTLETSLSLNYKLDFITKGLSAKSQISFDNQGENGRQWNRSTAEYVYSQSTNSYQKYLEDRPLSFGGTVKGYNWYKYYLEAGLNYNRTIGANTVTGLFLANRNLLVRDAEVPYANEGLVGRVTYDFDKRYFAEVNIGYNGSENFPKKLRYGFFPAVAGGWMLSNEDFIANTSLGKIITSLKVRGSVGLVGNDKSSDRFLFQDAFTNAGGYIFGTGNNGFSGIQQGSIANKKVTWEVARKQNIGFESEIYKGLLGVSVDYFYEYRNKILTDIENVKPEYVGAVFKPANIGETTNQGFEVELRHNNRINKSFSYFVKGNFTFTRNKILKKADRLGLLPYQKEEGYPIGTQLMWKNLGYFSSYEEIEQSPSQLTYRNGLPGNIEIVPGDLKFLDFNNDGVINQLDAFKQGYGSVPEIQYGVSIGMNWKAFDFSALVQGSTHAQFMKYWEIMWAFSNNDNVFDKHNYYWAPETASSAEFTRFYGKSWVNNERYFSTYEAGSGTYVRLKNIEVGYTVPATLLQKVNISNVRVFLSSNNTYMWAVEKYIDPDNRNIRGGQMPPTRAFNLGLNVNF